MTYQFHFIVISLIHFTACGNQVKDAQPSSRSDTPAVQSQPAPNNADTSTDMSDSGEPFQPIQKRWVPGKRSSAPFDRSSRIRARADRRSIDVLVLALDTSATQLQRDGTVSNYVVADSTVITGLRTNELFTDYCKVGSARADGLIGGVPRTGIWDQWLRPRLAWQFDTVTFRIRSIPTDSVTCVLIQPD